MSSFSHPIMLYQITKTTEAYKKWEHLAQIGVYRELLTSSWFIQWGPYTRVGVGLSPLNHHVLIQLDLRNWHLQETTNTPMGKGCSPDNWNANKAEALNFGLP